MTSPQLGPEFNDGSSDAGPTIPVTGQYPPPYPDPVPGTEHGAGPGFDAGAIYPYPDPSQHVAPIYPPPAYPLARQTNVLAIISLVLVFVFWPAAIVCGHIARAQIRRSDESGRGITTAALILGYGILSFWVLLVFTAATIW